MGKHGIRHQVTFLPTEMPDSFLSALIVCSTGASALWVAASAPARQEDARYGTLIVTVVATGIGLVSALTGHPNAQVDWAWAMSTVYIMARNDLQHTTYAMTTLGALTPFVLQGHASWFS